MVISVISLKLTKCCMLDSCDECSLERIINLWLKHRKRKGQEESISSLDTFATTHAPFELCQKPLVDCFCTISQMSNNCCNKPYQLQVVQSIINPLYAVLCSQSTTLFWDCQIQTAEESTERYPCSLYHHLWSPNLATTTKSSDSKAIFLSLIPIFNASTCCNFRVLLAKMEGGCKNYPRQNNDYMNDT